MIQMSEDPALGDGSGTGEVMNKKNFVLKGNVCYSNGKEELLINEESYLVCREGLSAGVYSSLPKEFEGFPIMDCKEQLIIPGLADLHIHAPQYAFRGMGMDLELLDWLNAKTFPEEAKYEDLEYAGRAYRIFAENMKKSATTRACVFATIHREGTELLMDLLEETGIKAMVGKVNMDRNSPDYLIEKSAAQAAGDTVAWIEHTVNKYENIKPILTPRFIPTCSDELMERLKEIQIRYQLPMQSHLSENQGEINWVKELSPKADFYGDAYDRFGLFGGDCRTIMAHCVYSGEQEIDRMRERGVYIAHCPESNFNLSSGIAPIRKYLDKGLNVGLGSDVAGGTTESVFKAMTCAVQSSKVRWRLTEESLKPLTIEEAFYLGTEGGGSFFGKVGSFKPGYEFDALVIDDSTLKHPQELGIKERLERVIYLSDERHITAKYAGGKRIL